jgi:hypothetical protein
MPIAERLAKSLNALKNIDILATVRISTLIIKAKSYAIKINT